MFPMLHGIVSQGSAVDWWLAGGIPASTDYTVYDPLVAADLAGSYVNLANPGTRNAAAPTNAPTWGATTGLNFVAASTQYLTTGAVVGPNYTIIAWVEGVPITGTGYMGGVLQESPTRRFYIRPDNGSQITFSRGGGNTSLSPDVDGGMVGMAGDRAYRNGDDLGSTLSAWTGGDTARAIFLGCYNETGNPATYFTGRIMRLALYDFVLTAGQIDAVTTAMLTPPTAYSLNAYAATVLSTSPLSYWPLNETLGSYAKDHTGNGYWGAGRQPTVGVAGHFGNSWEFAGVLEGRIDAAPTLSAAIDPDEFSVAMWINVDVNAALAVRLFNMYCNSGLEYFALEVRTGTSLDIYLKEAGATQNQIGIYTIQDLTDTHVVCYNSKSAGKFGVYVNGTKYEYTRTLVGFVGNPDSTYPQVCAYLDGTVQHVSIYDHALNQAEVNALYPGA